MFYWLLKRIVLGPVLHAIFRPWVERRRRTCPPSGAAILASNHLSFSDSIFLPLVLRAAGDVPGEVRLLHRRGRQGQADGGVLQGRGPGAGRPDGRQASDAALRTGLRVLRRGELLGIYPEGTRSPDGRLYRGKTGVARLALEAGVPVLPVAMIGTDKVQPIGRRIPKIGRVGVLIGRPLDFSRYDGMEDDRFVLRSITDEIMYELMELSGQEYVDMYAATMKERLAAARKSVRPVARAGAAGAVPRRVVLTRRRPRPRSNRRARRAPDPGAGRRGDQPGDESLPRRRAASGTPSTPSACSPSATPSRCSRSPATSTSTSGSAGGSCSSSPSGRRSWLRAGCAADGRPVPGC